MASGAAVTVAVPSFNQGRYLDAALRSVFAQGVPVEVYVADGGSTDESVDVIRRWEGRLLGWRSHRDAGQAAAINEGVARGSAPYVCWLNSDDAFEEGGLARLVDALERTPSAPMAYGRVWNLFEGRGKRSAVFVRPFSERLMAQLNIVSQPGTLIRRSSWEAVGGLDENLRMAMDYDLWWRLYRRLGKPAFVDAFVAVNREHGATKTNTQRRLHYQEAMAVVKKHYGRVPLKWWLAQPYAVWYRSLFPGG
ncbi:MAG TPA: glycosyltransferase family 2 protein [Usitatibacter sp.]|nr:glycosyltransferase family 2 protein [Usitatibacter sp.]